MTSERKQFIFSDYSFLNSLKSLPTGRLSELAVLHELSTLGYPLPKAYCRDEHELLWRKINELFESKGETGTLIDDLYSLIKVLSPQNNSTPLNAISLQVKLAIDIAGFLKKPVNNILEVGANRGTLSHALSIMGNRVLCTDLHHGIVSSSIAAYKVGTWFKENFIGLASVDSFDYAKDRTEYLKIFEGGLDAIVMRGTGVLGIPRLSCKLLKKLFRKSNFESNEYVTILYNCTTLLQCLNTQGVMYAAEENLFGNLPPEEKIHSMDRLVQDLSAFDVQASYTIKEGDFAPGWESFAVTLCCRKLMGYHDR